MIGPSKRKILMAGVLVFMILTKVEAECSAHCPTAKVECIQMGDGDCDLDCMNQLCSFDSIDAGASDCLGECAATGCSPSLLANGVCDPGKMQTDCESQECGWDFGDCGICAHYCSESALGDGACDPACDIEACRFDNGDCVTAEKPVIRFVDVAGNEDGKGTASDPYPTVLRALDALWAQFTMVNLRGEEVSLSAGSREVVIPSGMNVEIVGAGTVLQLASDSLTIVVSGQLTIQDVSIAGDFPLTASCSSSQCRYCPSLTFDSETEGWTDDRGDPVTLSEVAVQGVCDAFKAVSLLRVEAGGRLLLQNVEFAKVRNQLNALVENECGDIDMRNVTFRELQMAFNGSYTGVVKQVQAFSQGPYYCGSLQYSDGLVEYGNNGYEFSSTTKLGGFLAIVGMRLVILRNITLRRNNLLGASDSSPLIYIRNCRQVLLDNCIFEGNIARASSGLLFESDIPLPAVSTEHTLPHIQLLNCSFFNNTSTQSAAILSVVFYSEPLNVVLSGLIITNNFAGNGGLISVTSKALTEKYAREWVASGVLIPAAVVTVTGLHIESNYVPIAVNFSDLPALVFSLSSISDTGDSQQGITFQTYTVRNLIDDPQSYISRKAEQELAFTCMQTVVARNIYNVSVTSSTFDSCHCAKGSPGFSHQTSDSALPLAVQMHISEMVFTRNTGYGLLALQPSSDLELQNLVFEENRGTMSTNSVCLLVQPATIVGLSVIGSLFRGNVGQASVLGSFAELAFARLSHLTVTDNSASFGSSGFLFNPADINSRFEVKDSIFRNNTSATGVLVVDHTVGVGDLSADTCVVAFTSNTFEGNTALGSGSVLYIASAVQLSPASLMQQCVFRRNQAREVGGSIYLAYQSGVLTIADSTFTQGKAKDGAAIYAKHHTADPLATPPRLVLRGLFFSENSGDDTVFLLGEGFYSSTQMSQNRFERNRASCVEVSETIAEDIGSSYLLNTNDKGAAFQVHTNSELHASDLLMGSNAAETGGAMYISVGGFVSCVRCKFLNNSAGAVGGAVYLDQHSVFNASDSRFEQNAAVNKGAAVFLLFASLHLQNVTLAYNSVQEHGLVTMVSSTATVTDSQIRENKNDEKGVGLVLTLSTLFVKRSNFSKQPAEEGTFIFASDTSTIEVEDSVFDTGVAHHSGGAIYICLWSSLKLRNVHFRNCTSLTGSAIFVLRDGLLTIQDSTFSALTSYDSEGAINANDAVISISNTSFTDLSGGAIYGELLLSVTLINTTFSNVSADRGSALSCWSCSSVAIRTSTFTSLRSVQGGAIFLASRSEHAFDQVLSITQSRFENNSAGVGGCVFIAAADAEIVESVFLHNSAVAMSGVDDPGAGGAIVSTCAGGNCQIRIVGNRFQSNQAEKKCGAVCWNHSQPTFLDNDFSNNSAPYAPDIGSLPVQLLPINSAGVLLQFVNASSEPPLAAKIKNFCSGQTFDGHIYLALYDHHINIYTVDSFSTAEFSPSTNSSGNAYGNVKLVADKGIFTLTSTTLTGPPGTTQYFEVTAAGIESTGPEVTRTVGVEVTFRECLPGESLQDGVCHECTEGTFSFSPKELCAVCPSEAVCKGGLKVGPRPGYWRAERLKNIFFACPNPDSCLGAESLSEFSQSGWCAEGYSGNLCNACLPGYSKTSKYLCERCPRLVMNISLSVLLGLVALCVLAISIAISIKGAQRMRSELPILMKILMNYVQVLMISASLNLHWPNYVKKFLVAQELVGNMAEQIFSLDCFYQDVPSLDSFYVKVAVIMTLPALLFLLCVAAWCSLRLLFPITMLREKIQASVVMILFLLHPALSSTALSMFSCVEIKPEERWLEANTDVRCWDSSHTRFVLTMAGPGLAVWVVGLPMICFIEIARYKRFLTDEKIRMKYSFLYKGYGQTQFYWEFVILYRKVLLVSSSIFFATISTTVQALSVLVVGLVALVLQVYTSPFLEVQNNRLETKALIVSCVTIFAGLYYQTQDLSKTYKGQYAHIILFVVILIANGYFLVDWMRVVFPILIAAIRERFRSQKKPYRTNLVYPDKGTPEPGDFTADLSRAREDMLPSPSVDPTPPMNTSFIRPEQFTFPKESPTPDKT